MSTYPSHIINKGYQPQKIQAAPYRTYPIYLSLINQDKTFKMRRFLGECLAICKVHQTKIQDNLLPSCCRRVQIAKYKPGFVRCMNIKTFNEIKRDTPYPIGNEQKIHRNCGATGEPTSQMDRPEVVLRIPPWFWPFLGARDASISQLWHHIKT